MASLHIAAVERVALQVSAQEVSPRQLHAILVHTPTQPTLPAPGGLALGRHPRAEIRASHQTLCGSLPGDQALAPSHQRCNSHGRICVLLSAFSTSHPCPCCYPSPGFSDFSPSLTSSSRMLASGQKALGAISKATHHQLCLEMLAATPRLTQQRKTLHPSHPGQRQRKAFLGEEHLTCFLL